VADFEPVEVAKSDIPQTNVFDAGRRRSFAQMADHLIDCQFFALDARRGSF
jgi:hypothetical protein